MCGERIRRRRTPGGRSSLPLVVLLLVVAGAGVICALVSAPETEDRAGKVPDKSERIEKPDSPPGGSAPLKVTKAPPAAEVGPKVGPARAPTKAVPPARPGPASPGRKPGLGTGGAIAGPVGGKTGSKSGSKTGGTGGQPAGRSPRDDVPIAPGGYRVLGNRIHDAQGNVVIFRGVNKPGLEDKIRGEHHACREEFAMMRKWGCNIVRIPLNQTWWLEDTQGYKARVDDYINWTLKNDMAAIADVHRSAKGTSKKDEGHADSETVRFWREFARRYKDNGRLIFELYNEPRRIQDRHLWRGGNGVAGIQEMYNVIRKDVGAHQIILIGGNDWGYDLRGWREYPLDPGHYNVAMSAHPYSFKGKDTEAEWLKDWAFLSDDYPFILTEFGHAPNDPGNYAYERMVLDFAARRGLGWTAWAWTDYFRKHSMFRKDYNPPKSWGTVTTHGELIREYLARPVR
ncbi:MAG: glycoside hydrolase family 5 protein [Planctomycetota bacterium]|jgi:SAM-dependent methyltransferase